VNYTTLNGQRIRHMIQTLDKVHNSCNIKLAGFNYPVCILNPKKYKEAVDKLSANAHLGKPAKSYHFTTYGGNFTTRALYQKEDIENRKWYAGTRRWNSKSKYDLWIVFKNEKDRTLALMLLS
jgi:hypothetical protein